MKFKMETLTERANKNGRAIDTQWIRENEAREIFYDEPLKQEDPLSVIDSLLQDIPGGLDDDILEEIKTGKISKQTVSHKYTIDRSNPNTDAVMTMGEDLLKQLDSLIIDIENEMTVQRKDIKDMTIEEVLTELGDYYLENIETINPNNDYDFEIRKMLYNKRESKQDSDIKERTK